MRIFILMKDGRSDFLGHARTNDAAEKLDFLFPPPALRAFLFPQNILVDKFDEIMTNTLLGDYAR